MLPSDWVFIYIYLAFRSFPDLTTLRTSVKVKRGYRLWVKCHQLPLDPDAVTSLIKLDYTLN